MKIATLILTIAILGAIIYLEINNTPSDHHSNNNSPALVNNKVPDFKFTPINQKEVINLYSLKSTKTIIHFWASWCHVCTTEFKDILNYAKSHPDIKILAVAIDSDKVPLENYLKTLKNINKIKNLLFVWDHDRAISLGLFNSNIVPENYILNENHEITKKHIGKFAWSDET